MRYINLLFTYLLTLLGLEGQVLGLGLGLEQKSLALAKQVLGLARLVICHK